jgi:hypothetical protein
MATRSTIALEFADGTVQQVYSHWDGYLEHNGKILLEHYSNPFTLRDLIDLGSVSSLGPKIGVKHPFSQFEIKRDDPDFDKLIALHEFADKEGYTTFYGRDRGETDVDARKFADFADYEKNHQYEEFEYILRQVEGQAVWFVSQYSGPYVELAVELKKLEELGMKEAV